MYERVLPLTEVRREHTDTFDLVLFKTLLYKLCPSVNSQLFSLYINMFEMNVLIHCIRMHYFSVNVIL